MSSPGKQPYDGHCALCLEGVVQTTAQSAGFNLDPDVIKTIAPEVEFRLREITQDALKFMRHSKRQVLLADDINRGLLLHDVEPLYGYQTGSAEPELVAAGDGVFFRKDEEIDLQDIVDRPLSPAPRAPRMTAHWLAIEGVQPKIPQNITGTPSEEHIPDAPPPSTVAGDPSELEVRHGKSASTARVVPLVKHVVPMELQGYYDLVTEALSFPERMSSDLPNVLEGLGRDTGLQQLLPYLSQYISTLVAANLTNLRPLMAAMQATWALLGNPHMHAEPYLHQFLPAILTCVVNKRLCNDPATENHWALRDYAAQIVAHICQRYGQAYSSLQPRITKTLLHALMDPLKPFSTQYGAAVALGALGARVVQVLIIPNLLSIMRMVEAGLLHDNALQCMEARRLFGALLKSCGNALSVSLEELHQSRHQGSDVTGLGGMAVTMYQMLADVFGDAIQPYAMAVRAKYPCLSTGGDPTEPCSCGCGPVVGKSPFDSGSESAPANPESGRVKERGSRQKGKAKKPQRPQVESGDVCAVTFLSHGFV